jgi:hypothetical protein
MKTPSAPGYLLDDGEYYVVLNENQASDLAAGFLERRCFVSSSTPGGFEVLGSFAMAPAGTWEARITKVYDARDDIDCTVVARGVERMEAIVALWRARLDAYLGYHRH